jgi:hypothetical protein
MTEEKKTPEAIPDNVRFQRQLDLIKPERLAALKMHIIGAGAIGSSTALLTAKMGCREITIWDPDKFEEHNLPNQMCRIQDIGRPKVEAVAEMVMDFEGVEIMPRFERFNGEADPGSLVIMAVDSMKARKEIWEMIKKLPILGIMDGRMGLTSMSLYTAIFPSKPMIERYEQQLWDDAAVKELRCTAKSTIFTANTIASLICMNIVTYLKDKKPVPSEIMMELAEPFMRVWDYQGDLVKLEEF